MHRLSAAHSERTFEHHNRSFRWVIKNEKLFHVRISSVLPVFL